MTNTTCPTCGKPVDALRAPAVGVRDGKVVSFCSRECANANVPDSPRPPVRMPTDPQVVTKSGPMQPRAKSEPHVPATPKPGTPPAGVIAAEAAAAKSGKVRAPQPEIDSAPVIEILHEPASGVVTSAPDKRTEDVPEIKPKLVARKGSEPLDKQDDDDDDDEDDDDELERLRPSAADSSTTRLRKDRDRRDSLNAKQAIDWLDDEPAEPVRAGSSSSLGDEDEDVEPARGSGRGVITFLLVMLVLAGGGIAAYKYVYLPRQKPATAPPTKPEPLPTQTMSPTPTPDHPVGSGSSVPTPQNPAQDNEKVKAAVDKSRAVLKTYLTSDSARVQRVAAMALARTGDDAALTLLAGMLEQEQDEGPRLDIAYALARGGDKRGVDRLVAALNSTRRDIKLQAARLLALLGDKRAEATLASFLEVEQLRLGVAEQLANLADQRAIDALEAIRKDEKASPDDKARAAIALGIAGKQDMTKELHALLEDKRFNAFAAAALAKLHDHAARPVLLRQLDVPSLRVGAARSLRTLDPDLIPLPQLGPLVDSLASLKDTEQIQVAEAILLLAGPASWSEHA
jgi:HEAT repeat protein